MRKLSDYIFVSSWEIRDVDLRSYEEYRVLRDVGELKEGDLVKFIGYADVDNHYGIFLFTNAQGDVLEVGGDFSGSAGRSNLKTALSKKQDA